MKRFNVKGNQSPNPLKFSLQPFRVKGKPHTYIFNIWNATAAFGIGESCGMAPTETGCFQSNGANLGGSANGFSDLQQHLLVMFYEDFEGGEPKP